MRAVQGRARLRIVVVRHGQAESKKAWAGPDDDRPLVARGHRQAGLLDRVVGPGAPGRILSSPALRCRQTVGPLAERHGLEVEVADALATGAGRRAFDLYAKLAASEPPGSTVVLCTHREVLEDMLPRLAGELGRDLPHRVPGAKGGAWVLLLESRRLVALEYRPPAV